MLRVFRKTLHRRWRLFWCGLMLLAIDGICGATENGASVYPVGVETVLPGMTLPPGQTMLCEFTTFYSANEFVDGRGKKMAADFKVRVWANAFKVEHAWKVRLWGGTLHSTLAVPLIYQQLRLPSGKFTEFGIGNVAIGVLGAGYHKTNLHWMYEVDGWLPGASYSKGKSLNIGQHNYAMGPVVAFSYLPGRRKFDLSSRVQYIVNFRNADAGYQSGHEFSQEYAAMQAISKRISLGVNGFYYQQVTDDRWNGAPLDGGGRRGRDFAVGPQVRIRLGRFGGLAFKYQRDTLVQNRPRGDALWFQLGLPLGKVHE